MKSQHLSLEISGRLTSIRLDDHFRRPLIPLHARQATFVPPQSTVAILVSTPISSLSAYFIPTSNVIEHPYLSSTQKIVTIQNHHSSLLVTNSSNVKQYVPEFFCFGYLLSNQAKELNFFKNPSWRILWSNVKNN